MANVVKEQELDLGALRSCLSYDPETGLFIRKKTGTPNPRAPQGGIAGCVMANGYRVIKIGKIPYLAGRLAWFFVHGKWPKDEIDHINRCRDDNRLSNLRTATRQQNTWNSGPHKDGTGIKHISRKRRSHQVSIFRDGKTVFRKSFACLGIAVKARNAILLGMGG